MITLCREGEAAPFFEAIGQSDDEVSEYPEFLNFKLTPNLSEFVLCLARKHRRDEGEMVGKLLS